MKIRGLLAGLVVVVAATGCNGSPTAPKTLSEVPAAHDEAPTDTTANRGGGVMGTGT